MIIDDPSPHPSANLTVFDSSNRRKLEQAYQLIKDLSSSELVKLQEELDRRLRIDPVLLLPHEVSLVILGFLSCQDLLACSLVSRSWSLLSQDQALWKSLCDSEPIYYHPSLPLATLRRRQAECFLRRSGPRLTVEDEGWDRNDEGDPTAQWSAGAGAFLQPWVSNTSNGSLSPLPPPPEAPYLSLFAPTFTPSSIPSHHSSPAALPSLVRLQPDWRHPIARPPSPPLATSFPDPDLDEEVHVPNYKHLYLTSRILSLRPSSLSYNPTLQTLSPQAPSPTALFLAPPPSAYSTMLWSRAWALVAARDRTVRIWDFSVRGEEKVVAVLASESGHAGSVLSLWVGKGEGDCGVRVVTAGSDGKVVVWWVDGRTADGPEGRVEDEKVETRLEAVIEAHGGVSVLCVRSDDVRIVSCSKDRTIRTFDATTFEPLLRMVGHRAAVNAISLAGDRIVSASGDRSIRIWDALTGQALAVLEAHQRGVASVDFDGRFVLSGSSDAQVRLSDIDDPSHPSVTFGPNACARPGVETHDVRCICNCGRRGHSDLVRTLQMGKDLVVSGSYDKSVMIWDRKTNALVRELTDGHTQRVFCVAFDQTKIISVGQDGRLVVHRFDDGLDTSFLRF